MQCIGEGDRENRVCVRDEHPPNVFRTLSENSYWLDWVNPVQISLGFDKKIRHFLSYIRIDLRIIAYLEAGLSTILYMLFYLMSYKTLIALGQIAVTILRIGKVCVGFNGEYFAKAQCSKRIRLEVSFRLGSLFS